LSNIGYLKLLFAREVGETGHNAARAVIRDLREHSRDNAARLINRRISGE
jgi:hypothetical protein